ncbi:MAG: hypothetical protein AAFO07_06630 [Bacteroidota bacterium]
MRSTVLLIFSSFILSAFSFVDYPTLPTGKYVLIEIRNQTLTYTHELPFDTLTLIEDGHYFFQKGVELREKGTYTINTEDPTIIQFQSEGILGICSLSLHPRKFIVKSDSLIILENSCDHPEYSFCGTPKLNEVLIKGDSIKYAQFGCSELKRYTLLRQ